MLTALIFCGETFHAKFALKANFVGMGVDMNPQWVASEEGLRTMLTLECTLTIQILPAMNSWEVVVISKFVFIDLAADITFSFILFVTSIEVTIQSSLQRKVRLNVTYNFEKSNIWNYLRWKSFITVWVRARNLLQLILVIILQMLHVFISCLTKCSTETAQIIVRQNDVIVEDFQIGFLHYVVLVIERVCLVAAERWENLQAYFTLDWLASFRTQLLFVQFEFA